MKIFAFVAIILLAASALFADTAIQQYTAGDWLAVTRTISNAGEPSCLDSRGITDACAAGGAIQPNEDNGKTVTQVTLTAQNTGAVTRTGVGITEDISYVPAGSQVTFTPSPSSSSGRTVTWNLPTMRSGETDTFTYTVSARISPVMLSAIPDVAVGSDSTTLSLSAPDTLSTGDRATVNVESQGGTPVPNAVVVVTYPDGVKHAVRTDSSGSAKFTAKDAGTYTYSIDGYSLSKEVATDVSAAQIAVPSAPVAAAQDTGFAASIMGALPYLAGIFAIVVIAFIIYNFFTSRRAEEEYMAGETQPPTPAAGTEGAMTYSQKFSFAGDTSGGEEKNMQERTHGLVESRKRRLAAAVETPVENEAPSSEGASAESTEMAASDEDMAQILSELEHKARTTGEVAKEQEEVERTIAELESIRDKLRAMRTKGKGAQAESEGAEGEEAVSNEEGETAEEEPSSEDEAPSEGAAEAEAEPEEETTAQEETSEEPEEEEAAQTPKYKPSARKVVYEHRVEPKVKPVSKGKKMRFGNRSVKKR